MQVLGILTYGIAQYIFRDLADKGLDFAQYAMQSGYLTDWFSEDNETNRSFPGTLDYAMNTAINFTGQSVLPPSFVNYPQIENEYASIYSDVPVDCDTAVVFLDKNGNVLRENGDYIYFGYYTDEQWLSDDTSTAPCRFGWMDLNEGKDSENRQDDPYALFRTTLRETYGLSSSISRLRITGVMDGSRIYPLAMAYLDDGMVSEAVEQYVKPEDVVYDEDGNIIEATYSYSISELDCHGYFEWQSILDRTEEYTGTEEPVTIYVEYPKMYVYESAPVSYRNERHENLLALLKTMGVYQYSGRNSFFNSASQFDLWNMVVFNSQSVFDYTNSESTPEVGFTVMTAVQASPLKISMLFLRYVYIVAFALALIGYLAIRSSIKKRFIAPLSALNEGMSASWHHIPELVENPPKWKEPFELGEHYQKTADKLRADKNEITRLNSALDYAKTAEQNRRQMTSNIAHELKTPLAVIHSYAEGLKEHIADDKRDKYLDVILSESERMDGMVLEMLDLSRLEAGKVKLARDEFSLTALARGIFEKLEVASEAKALNIEYDFPEDCIITADEARIAQVIENFATNAIKYTPVDGHIGVRIAKMRGGTGFSIENDSDPLSNEALSKVWDTFYRTDEARAGGGTGLGLAIAKSIIELHGGKCTVRNTNAGVEFGFTL